MSTPAPGIGRRPDGKWTASQRAGTPYVAPRTPPPAPKRTILDRILAR